MTFATTDITGTQTFIIETGNYEMMNGNKSLIDRGKYVVVWGSRNGEWKLYRDIGSTSMPAAKQIRVKFLIKERQTHKKGLLLGRRNNISTSFYHYRLRLRLNE